MQCFSSKFAISRTEVSGAAVTTLGVVTLAMARFALDQGTLVSNPVVK
jgi:hypothetical protein